VIGTSLAVHPFATFLHRAKEDDPVVIMNKENNLKTLD
jgi:NAD-dependent SIR2 family protein deacetylase